jgi:hypothetical protein
MNRLGKRVFERKRWAHVHEHQISRDRAEQHLVQHRTETSSVRPSPRPSPKLRDIRVRAEPRRDSLDVKRVGDQGACIAPRIDVSSSSHNPEPL